MATRGLTSIGERVRWALLSTGLSQSDFAKRTHISPGFISEVVRGVKMPGLDMLRGLNQELGVSVDWLVTGTGHMDGAGPIDRERLETIRLLVGTAREAVLLGGTAARELLAVLPNMPIEEVWRTGRYAALLESVGCDLELLALSVALYNGHLSATDPADLRRAVLAFATAHYEAKRARIAAAQNAKSV